MSAQTGRGAALAALAARRRSGAWADSFLRNAQLDPREAALARQLCYGVLQNLLLLDFYIESFSTVPIKKMEPSLPDILRLGIYQLVFTDKRPASAAVNEAVSQARKKCSPRAAGLCNGVLRAVARAKDALPAPKEDYIRLSHPKWLYDRFVEILGRREAEALMAADNARVATCAQINTLRADATAVLASLKAQGARAELKAGGVEISGAGDVGELEAFKKGWIYVQDNAAAAAVRLAGPKPGMRVIDACAAPGGKSVAAALLMENRGEIISCDIHENKLGQINAAAKRLGIDIITTRAADASQTAPGLTAWADLVIADVPCSGLGVIRKKPDIRYKSPEELKNLPQIQFAILKNLSGYVKPGGVLLYSTCTLLPEENGGVTGRFLKTGDFTAETEKTLYPHTDGCDGFYICVMRRAR